MVKTASRVLMAQANAGIAVDKQSDGWRRRVESGAAKAGARD